MIAAVRPLGREYRVTPSRYEKPAGRQEWPPKSPERATLAPRCCGTGRAREGRKVRRDESRLEIVMDGPKKTPRPGARGAANACEDIHGADFTAPASIRRRYGRAWMRAHFLADQIGRYPCGPAKRQAIHDFCCAALAALRDG